MPAFSGFIVSSVWHGFFNDLSLGRQPTAYRVLPRCAFKLQLIGQLNSVLKRVASLKNVEHFRDQT